VGYGFHFQYRNSEDQSDDRYLRNAPLRWAQVTYVDIFIKTLSRFRKLIRMDRYTVKEIGDLISRFIFFIFKNTESRTKIHIHEPGCRHSDDLRTGQPGFDSR
jgi:hypothetical protein